ncbi:PIN domain-like protein [Panaeolus papilionaceus]|nr:PIN domain-like protein [Panaeolus papilionaceus]
MGVNGITPFLKRFCPDVLQPITGRFKALKGKRIVLDGTLITQRFHYAQDPHPNKHVLGWYRLAKELHDAGVSAICLFDGKERSKAKSGEVQRRQKVRELVHTRSKIEQERFQRLRGLKDALREFEAMEEGERKRVAGAFLRSEVVRKMQGRDLSEEEEGVGVGGSVKEREREVKEVTEVKEEVSPTSPQQLIQSLYLSYCADTSQLAALPQSAVQGEEKEKEKGTEQALEHVSTKAQHELSVQENAVWRDLSRLLTSMSQPPPSPPVSTISPTTPQDETLPAPSTPPPTPTPTPTPAPTLTTIHSHLSSIQHKSYTMSSSFERRTNAPRESTYNESKALLRAAGIPCINAPSAVEAEAFAAAIVMGGYAEFVGSEDTDVLVYEAPMLKNITARTEPLVLVNGSDVRRALSLTKPEYIDFALLLGTDFTQRIKGVGPMKALGYLRRWGSIEGLLERSGETDGSQTEEVIARAEAAIETEGAGVITAGSIRNEDTHSRKSSTTSTASKSVPPVVDKEKYMRQVEIARMIFGKLPGVPDEVREMMGGGRVEVGVSRGAEGGAEGEGVVVNTNSTTVVEGVPAEGASTKAGARAVSKEEPANKGSIERPTMGEWDDAQVREILKKHKLEFVLLEMDLDGVVDYSRAIGDGYFGDDPTAIW